ncbi:MAG: hypothetical protein GY863_22360 [bacterium]|nr:hypothetical protein [bacterium]
MRRFTKILLILLGILLVTILLVLLGRWVYRKWWDDIATMDIHIVDTTKDGLFNTSYALVHRDGQVQFHGYGRPKKGHNKLYLKIIDSSGNLISAPTKVELPPQVLDTNVGEMKGFTFNDQFYVYTNFFGKRESLDIFPRWASKLARELYFKSDYKNYLWNMNTGKVVPLFYDVLPGPELTNKNFLFFQDGKKILVITSVSPHRIYELDMSTGYMQPYVTTTNEVMNFLGSDHRVNLSGGPVRIPHKGCYIVAGHVSKGGWGGLRMTFFYTFKDSYPYDVLSISAPVSFGFSNKLEYCNQMFEYEGSIHLSIGVNDDYSTLIRVDPEEVFSVLRPLDCNLRSPMCGYRLGDMIKYTNMRNTTRGKEWHIRTYPESIAAEYLRITTNEEEDLDVLTNIITKRSRGKKMEGIALHLRIGDVIEGHTSSAEDIANSPAYYYHSGNRDQYTPCWGNIKKCLGNMSPSLKIVTIFAAAHTKEKSYSKSCEYIRIIQQRLEEAGYSVVKRLGGDPDEDFISMTTAPYFIQSGGGYSKLISDVRKKLGLPSCKATL